MRASSHRTRLFGHLRSGFAISIAALLLTLAACGGGSSKATTPLAPTAPIVPVTVTVAPKAATVSVNATQNFTATVTGTTNTAVTWAVTETSGGTIDSTGKYTAPAKAGTYHVVATSAASSTVSDTATVTVPAVIVPVVTVAVAPKTVTLAVGTAQNFTATVTGTTNTAVTWAVSETNGGTVDTTGKYTAPVKAGTYHVVATSAANSTVSDTATVTVPVVTVAVAPKAVTLVVGTPQIFTATVTGTANTAVTWTVTEASGAAIDSTGKFTTSYAGTYHVVATSQASTSISDTATVTVTAPAPTFTSTANTAALQDTPYTYILTASDPTVTFTLTSGPSDATLSGGTLTWTPTAAESRVDNAFTVTATTAAGGTVTQSFTVNPNGTVQVSWIDTYWTANGQTLAPNDFSGYTITATVPNSDGTFTTLPSVRGSGTTAPLTREMVGPSIGEPGSVSTVAIQNVPAGYYWLNMGNGQIYWTNSSTFDFGSDYSGRQPSYAGSITLTLNLTGLDPVTDDSLSTLMLSVPNENMSECNAQVFPWSDTTFAGTCQYINYTIDPTLGDVTYVIQDEEPTGLSSGFDADYVPGPSLALPDFALTTSGGSLTGTLAKTNPEQQQDFNIQGWAGSFNNVSPVPTTPNWFNAWVDVQPFVTDIATQSSTKLVEIRSNSGDVSSDVNAGKVSYYNPYPLSWLTVYGADALQYFTDANGTEYYVENGYKTTTPPTNGFAPLMSAVQNPKMNGASLFTAASITTTSVTLSWTAPTGGLTPAGYEIYYIQSGDNSSCSGGNEEDELYTATTSVTIPPGLLGTGCTYIFDIAAVADSRANFNSSPNRSGYPFAFVDVISAPLSIAADQSAPPAPQSAVARGAQANITRTKYGTFLVTPNGNKPLDFKARMLSHVSQHAAKAQAAKTAMK